MKYAEGDWFGVPLRDGGYGVGLVARTNPKAGLLGYFFGPRRASPPTLDDVVRLTAGEAVLAGHFSHIGLKDGTWPIVGRAPAWDRSEWPSPEFARFEELTGRWFLVIYDDDDPAKRLREEEVSAAAAQGRPEDGLMGAGFVERRLTRLLGNRLPSSDIAER